MSGLVEEPLGDEGRGASSRILTFVVVLWGEKFRRLFLDYCLASLLAPQNLPFVATEDARGVKAKLIICSTRPDYDALTEEPLFALLRRYAEVSLIDIGYPETSIMLHMSKGHKAALSRCIAEKSYCSVLAPDIILANGSVRTLVEVVNRNIRVALFPAFRFDLHEVRARLATGGYLVAGKPMAIEPRRLAAIAAESLHSEMQRFEFDRACFGSDPHSTIFRRPGNGWLFHTVSWGVACADFSCLESLSDEHFDVDTIDAHFINDQIFRRPKFGEPVTLGDSDDFLMVPLTAEQDMPGMLLLRDSPLYSHRPMGQVEDIKIGFIRSLLFGPSCDDFKRWAYRIPVNIHPEPLPRDADVTGGRAAAIVARALEMHRLPAPLYLMVAVCSLDELDQLFAVLLPSLLAPNNVPALAGIPGCRLLIATTAPWAAEIFRHRLLERLSSAIAVEFIDFQGADLGDAPHATAARALARCAARCIADGVFGSFLWPDLLVSDGSLRRVIALVDEGYEAAVVAVPPFRFQSRKRESEWLGSVEEIVLSGRRPVVFSGRQLANGILDCLEADPLEQEPDPAPPQPRPRSLAVKTAGGFIFHGADWAVLFCDFRFARETTARLSDVLTRSHARGKLYVVTDSDELAFLSVTHGVGRGVAPAGTGSASTAQSNALDPLLRALYLRPVWLHAGDLPPGHEILSAQTVSAATTALEALSQDAPISTRAERRGREKPRYFYQWRIPWVRRAKPDLVRTLKETVPALRWLVLLSAGAWHYRGPIWRRVTAVLKGDRESIRWLLAHLHRAGSMVRAVDQSSRAAAAHKKATRKS